MAEDTSWGGRLLTWFVVAMAAIVALKLGAWLAGMLVGVFFFLLFTVVPLVVLGWLIVKLFRVFREDDEYHPA